jgi:hypothetical protein
LAGAESTLLRAVSVTFSLLSLRMGGGHEYALYVASRSIALPLAVLYAIPDARAEASQLLPSR